MYPHGACATCKTITLAALRGAYKDRLISYSPDYLLLSYPSILSSSKSCPLCAVVLRQIKLDSPSNLDFLAPVSIYLWTQYQPGRGEPGPENLRIADVRIFLVQQGDNLLFKNCIFRVCADEGTYASKWIIARPVAPMKSPQTLRQIQRWLRQCDGGCSCPGEGGHQDCSVGLSGEAVEKKTILPSRLVDVRVPRLCITAGRRGQFTALSHRWGGKSPLTTTRTNLDDHKQRIPAQKLPKTFRDAIELTRRLGIRYIWIDSLCIVQDDAGDWAAESKQMGTIYERGYLTIAATSSVDGDGGLFQDTAVHDHVKFPCGSGPGHMYFTNYYSPSEIPMVDMELGPLNTRGWVFQERLLSRRILHFMPAQLYWECLGGIVSQSGLPSDCDAIRHWHRSLELSLRDIRGSLATTHVHPAHPLQLDNTDSGQGFKHDLGHLHFHRAWEQALCYYLTRALTFPSDRLVALQGVMERLQKRTGFGCVLGHWSDSALCFIKSLAWAVAGPLYAYASPASPGPPCPAPSWSWLGRPIYYPQDCFWSSWLHVEAPFGMRLDPPGLKRNGEPCALKPNARGLSLTVSGLLNSATKGPPLKDPYDNPNDYQFTVRVGMIGDYDRAFALVANGVLGWIRFDTGRQPDSFCCCPMYVSPAGITNMVLERRSGEFSGEFQRIGIAMVCGWQRGNEELDRDAVASWLDSPRTVFEVV